MERAGEEMFQVLEKLRYHPALTDRERANIIHAMGTWQFRDHELVRCTLQQIHIPKDN